MTIYLQMDGVDDFIRTPSLSFTEIVMDCTPRTGGSGSEIVDARSGTTYRVQYTGSHTLSVYGFTEIYLNGVLKTSPVSHPEGQRVTIRLVGSLGTDDINFYSYSGGSAYAAKGDIYNIKVYNGAALVAHYDMSTGTVQDQSGNGKHATLTGGTWLDTAGTTATDLFSTRQTLMTTSTDNFATSQNIIAAGTAATDTFSTKQVLQDTSTVSFSSTQQMKTTTTDLFATSQNIAAVGTTASISFSSKQVLYDNLTVYHNTLQRMIEMEGTPKTIEFDVMIDVWDPYAARTTLVIEHVITGEKFMYPHHNSNQETATGFIQIPFVPEGFRMAADQTPVPVQYYQDGQRLSRYAARDKDPLNQHDWSWKLW